MGARKGGGDRISEVSRMETDLYYEEEEEEEDKKQHSTHSLHNTAKQSKVKHSTAQQRALLSAVPVVGELQRTAWWQEGGIGREVFCG